MDTARRCFAMRTVRRKQPPPQPEGGGGRRPRSEITARGVIISVAAVVASSGAALGQYRSINGAGTNQAHPAWGSAGTQYLREGSGAHYVDGFGIPVSTRPSTRLISNMISSQPQETADERGLSTCVYEFGQFLDHDLGLTLGATTEPMPIPVPLGDPYFDPAGAGDIVIGFTRSAFDPSSGLTSPRQQVNVVTSFIDASQVYGSDDVRAAWLRTFSGGHLKADSATFGEMLPRNDGSMANDNPVGAPPTSLYVAGDVRANEQVGLTVLHTIFLREHNWQADRLHSLNPAWDDERLYQEARKVVGAEMQVIVYKEFLPAMLGHDLPSYAGYDPGVNPGLSNAFATAAYRIGHSMVGPDIDLLDDHFEEMGVVELSDAFFNPGMIPQIGGLEPVVRYMATGTQQRTDTQIVEPLRNFLFGPPGAGGFDLAALNIQRGRDHGLADYNTLRADFGLSRVESFSQITSDADLAQRLSDLYGSADDIDPWVGMLAEDHLPGSSIGQTHDAILTDQFVRLRDGDPMWYQIAGFSDTELARIEATRLSHIFRRNTNVTRLQENVFFASAPRPECAADFNADGYANSADLFDFIIAFFNGSQTADVNADSEVTSQDFFAFLTVFFTPC